MKGRDDREEFFGKERMEGTRLRAFIEEEFARKMQFNLDPNRLNYPDAIDATVVSESSQTPLHRRLSDGSHPVRTPGTP